MKFRTPCPQKLEELRCNLLKLEKLPSFLNVILPSDEKIQHDHCHFSRSEQASDVDVNSNEECNDVADLPNQPLVIQAVAVEQNILEKLILTAEEKEHLELCTRQQSECDKWHNARRLRITGSKCGRILLQKKRTVSLLQFCIYPKVMQHLPKPIAWGIKNEDKARQEYVKIMEKNGHYGIEATWAGFVVHPRKCWLGASPDAWVTDASVTNPQGIAEFKCPYSKAFVHPRETCKNADFYCSIIDGQICLKRTHSYYHQIQLQLHVSPKSKWRDFCMYTTCGIAIERIYPDPLWEGSFCNQLDDYYMQHVLPELISPEHKPSYYL